MNPREADPTGAFSSGGGAGLDGGDADREKRRDRDPSRLERQDESITPGVDETERQVITSGTAATSEVADRDAQQEAEGQGDGTALPR